MRKLLSWLCIPVMVLACLLGTVSVTADGEKQYVVMGSLPYNWDAFATFDNPADGNFDEGGWTIPADELVRDTSYFGIPFHYGPTGAGQNNSVRSIDGNTDVVMPVTEGYYEKVYVLASAYFGDQELYLILNFSDGTNQEYTAPVADWCNNDDGNRVYQTSYRYDKDGNTHENTAAYIRFFEVGVSGQNTGKVLKSITMVGPHHPWVVVFAVTMYGRIYTGEPETTKAPKTSQTPETSKVPETTKAADSSVKPSESRTAEPTRDESSSSETETTEPNESVSETESGTEPELASQYVQMDIEYTDDVFSTSGNPGDGEFDGAQSVFPVDSLENEITFGDMPFRLGSFEDGKKNAIKSIRHFDTDIKVTRGQYEKIGFLYSMYGGDYSLNVDLVFSDGTVQKMDLGFVYDWTNGGDKSKVAVSSTYRYEKNSGDTYKRAETPVYIYGTVKDIDAENQEKELTRIRIPADQQGGVVVLAVTGFGKESSGQENPDDTKLQFVQMTDLQFNTDAFANNENKGDGNIDGNGNTFPSDGLEDQITFNKIPFALGSFEDGQMNAFGGDGQKLELTKGKYQYLYLLYTVCGGDRDFNIDLLYTDGTVENVTLGFAYDWTNGSGGNVAVRQDFRYIVTVRDFDGEPAAWETESTPVHIYACSVAIDPANTGKILESILMHGSDQNFIFAVTGYGEAEQNEDPNESRSEEAEETSSEEPVTESSAPSETAIPSESESGGNVSPRSNKTGWLWGAGILTVAAAAAVSVILYRRKKK